MDPSLPLHDSVDRLTFQPPAPARRPKGRPRFHRIVLAQDGSPGAVLAEEWAAWLGRQHDAEVVVATVLAVPTMAGAAEGYAWGSRFQAEYRRIQDLSRAAAGESATRLAKAGLRARQVVVPGRPVATLARIVEEERADLVVLGSVRRGAAARMLLGSVGQGVLNRVGASVLLARRPPPAASVVVGVDGSHESHRAAAYAVDLAARAGAHAHVEHVVDFDGPTALEPIAGHLRDTIARLHLPALPGVTYRLSAGEPGDQLLARASEVGADVLVVGSRGFGAIAGALLGSVSQKVAARSDASVLVLKRPDHED